MTLELYVGKSISRRWQTAVKGSATPRIFSPYITSTTADTVAKAAIGAGQHCEIYTLFDAELFASGASTLATLKRLLTAGHSLFHLPELHAKIVLVPNEFASIGSQNLTNRGTRSKEASVAFTQAEEVSKIEQKITPWLHEAAPITKEMIEEMARNLPSLKKLYRTAAEAAHEVTKLVFENEQVRLLAYEREKALRDSAREQAAMSAIHKSQLQAGIAKSIQAQEKIYAVVKEFDYGSRISLSAQYDARFTEWTMAGKTVSLDKQGENKYRRYLCIHTDTGRIGWARVAQGVISRISNSVNRTQIPLYIEGVKRILTISAIPNPQHKGGRNVSIGVTNELGRLFCTVHARLTIDDLSDFEYEVSEKNDQGENNRIADWIKQNPESFRLTSLHAIMSPFKYLKALGGEQADHFFGKLGTQYCIQLNEIGGEKFLTATRL
jgi:hypothetical protein